MKDKNIELYKKITNIFGLMGISGLLIGWLLDNGIMFVFVSIVFIIGIVFNFIYHMKLKGYNGNDILKYILLSSLFGCAPLLLIPYILKPKNSLKDNSVNKGLN